MNYKDGQTGPGSFQLPNTGGTGTLLMIIGGIVLIIIAGGYFVRRHSKQRQSKIL
jgi:LPXTG-motif cell wall-anchored protein